MPCQVPKVPTKVRRSASAGTPSSARARCRSSAVKRSRVEDVRVDAVGVEEDPLARRAQLHRLLDEGLRDHHHQLGVSQAGALDPLRQRLEAQPLAPVTLGPDLRAVELEDERHLQALAQQRPGHVVEGEALVDEVGRDPPRLLTSGAQEDTLVAVRVHLEGEGDEEAGKDDPLGARRGNERLLVGADEAHGDAGAGEGVRDPCHVGDRAADTRAEAQGGLEVEAPGRAPDSLGDEGPGDEAPGAPPGGRESDDSDRQPAGDPEHGPREVPRAQRGGRLSGHLPFPPRARHEEGEHDQVVLEEDELAHRSADDDRVRAPLPEGAEARAAQAGQVGEGDVGPEAGEEEAPRLRGRRGGGENEGRSRFGAGHTRWSGQTTTRTT